MSTEKVKQELKEPFFGAYYVGLLITVALLIGIIAFAAGLNPGVAGFGVAFLLGLTLNPKYALPFLIAGVAASILGFAGKDLQVSWGGLGIALASIIVWRFVKK